MNQVNNRKLDVVKLSSYTPKSYAESVKKDVVQYGENNDFPEYLINLYYGSPTHGAVCKTKAQMLIGDGFNGDAAALEELERLNLTNVIEKAALDFVIQGGFYLEVLPSLDKSRIAKVSHVEFERIRATESDSEGVIHTFLYCEDWTDSKKNKQPIEIPAFDPKSWQDHERSLIYVRPFTAGLNHYPKPDYLGAVNYVELEMAISKFLINHMNNGMSPSTWVHFLSGEPDDEEKRRNRRDLEQQYGGVDNSGQIIITYSDNAERKPQIEQVEVSDAPKQWEFISDHVTDKILIAHRVTTPVLFGVKEAGQLGATQELEMGAKLFEQFVINPMRRHLEECVNDILLVNGISSQVELVEGSLFGEAAQVEQSYTGIQISSALDIIGRSKLGEITINQAKQLLVSMLQFPEEVVDSMFAEDVAGLPNPQQLSKQCPTFSVEQEKAWIAHLEGKGEVIDLDEWELVLEEDAGGHEGHSEAQARYDVMKFFENYANPQDASEWGDAGLYKLRYKYEGGVRDNSRDFCRVMMNFSNQGIVYRYEDIATMSDRGVNGQFAPQGENTYDIFLHKGGVNCHHLWKRVIYFRKTDRGRFLPKSKTKDMENDKRVQDSEFVPSAGKEAVRPIDTPTKGRLNLTAIIDKILNK